ncbi:MAG: hypothetical protein FJ102_23840 [Deltaproteobacteria bacterium]|nr:hypothetical protein [Deltaproteobacteria bacterium]
MPGVKAGGALRPGWRARVPDYPRAMAWTPGGDALLVLDAAGGLHAFDGTTGAVRWRNTEAHPGGGLALSHHPRSARVATGGHDGTVAIWDSALGEPEARLSLGKAWVEHVRWSPNGDWLAAAAGRALHAWSAQGQEWVAPAHPSTVSGLVWAGAGEIATACYGRVAFWTPRGDAATQTLEWRGSPVSLAVSPDGAIVAVGGQDQTVHFWRRSTAQDSAMSGYTTKPAALAFDASGNLLATSGGEAVTVWSFSGNGPEGTTPGQLEVHPLPVTALAFARREHLLASGGREGGVVLWRLDPTGAGVVVGGDVLPGAVAEVAWRSDDRCLAATDAEGGVSTWRVSR